MKPLEISYINRALFVLALSALLTPASTHAASAFYQHFIEVHNTKKGFLWDSDLVQTNNPGPDLTNAPIPYARFAEGEIAEVRLGMTMQEVIDHWGKPCELVTYCGIGPRFWYGRESDWYGNISLSFVGDRLVALAVTGSVAEQLRFDNGLTGKMGKADYQRVLGTPLAGRKRDEARMYSGNVFYRSGEVRMDLSFTAVAPRTHTRSPEHLECIAVSLEREAFRNIPIEPDDSDDVDPRSLIPPPPTNSIVAPGVLYMTSHSNLMDISNAVTVASGLRIGMPRAEVDKYMREHGIIRTNLYSLRLVRDRTLICPYSLAAPETSLVLEMQCSQSKPRSLDCENPVLSRAYIQSEGANILSINLH